MLQHSLIYKVFDYYKSLGVLEVTMTSLPDSQPNHPVLTNLWMYKHNDPHLQLWRDEPISVNDCILRNMNQFQYIANIDNDEMIIPEEYRDWKEMVEGLGNDTADIEVNFQINNLLHNNNFQFYSSLLGHSVSSILTFWMICWRRHSKTSQRTFT